MTTEESGIGEALRANAPVVAHPPEADYTNEMLLPKSLRRRRLTSEGNVAGSYIRIL